MTTAYGTSRRHAGAGPEADRDCSGYDAGVGCRCGWWPPSKPVFTTNCSLTAACPAGGQGALGSHAAAAWRDGRLAWSARRPVHGTRREVHPRVRRRRVAPLATELPTDDAPSPRLRRRGRHGGRRLPPPGCARALHERPRPPTRRWHLQATRTSSALPIRGAVARCRSPLGLTAWGRPACRLPMPQRRVRLIAISVYRHRPSVLEACTSTTTCAQTMIRRAGGLSVQTQTGTVAR